MIAPDTHLQIGSLLFEGLDQIDLTGPFEVLSQIPNSTCRIYRQDGRAGARSAWIAADAGCEPWPRRRSSISSMCPAASARKP